MIFLLAISSLHINDRRFNNIHQHLQNLLAKGTGDYDHMDTNCDLLSTTSEGDDCSLDVCSDDNKSSPMWCTKYDGERLVSSSDEDELDLLKYTKRRRPRRARPNLRKSATWMCLIYVSQQHGRAFNVHRLS